MLMLLPYVDSILRVQFLLKKIGVKGCSIKKKNTNHLMYPTNFKFENSQEFKIVCMMQMIPTPEQYIRP